MTELDELLAVMAKLRDPDGGCPWDLEQDFASIAPYTLEEAYEVADAIERGDLPALREELGDLLFQVVFHSRLAEERGAFDFRRVARDLVDKMRRRHPHVFGGTTLADAATQTVAWEEHKARERATRKEGVLDGVPVALPALARAQKLGRRAARVGFDWPDAAAVLEKVAEETRELKAAIAARATAAEAVGEELGDLLFSIANLARHLDVDAETALRRAGLKFETRFRHMEAQLAAAGSGPEEAGMERLEQLWNEAKEATAGR
jgi:MazG family protein